MQLVTYPGEPAPKYFTLNSQKSEARFYGLNHTTFKTINIPHVNGPIKTFNYFSRNTFDKDDAKEYLISFKDTSNSTQHIQVIDDDQSTMLNTKGHYAQVEKADTGKLVLMVYHHQGDTTQTKIYELGGTDLPVDYERPSQTFEIYPNPTKSKLNIMFGSRQVGNSVSFSLFNSVGKEILRRKFSNLDSNATINVDALKPEVYIAQLTYANGRALTRKVIITD